MGPLAGVLKFNDYIRKNTHEVTDLQTSSIVYFVCVGVMYSGENDVCDVTLSVHPHRAS
jgi:hypothetical protein